MTQATYPLFAVVDGTASASGDASVQFGPQFPREVWDVDTITVTSLSSNVSVLQFGRVVDSTSNDPRATVTSNTPYHLGTGTIITVQWTGLPANQPVQVVVNGKRTVGTADMKTG